jgi:hypothetical protein
MIADLTELTRVFIARGDLAHLALFLWAGTASILLFLSLRELSAANRRLNDFIELLARFARRVEGE